MIMDAKDEQRSLTENPLPLVVILDPLTRVWEYDSQIAKLQEQIADLHQKRAEALNYAIQEQISEDENYRLDRKAGRILREIDPDKFREVFPREWEMMREIEINDLNAKIANAGKKISVTLADKLIKKPVLNAAPGVVTVTQAPDTYQVVKK
jgi:predicted transcriptional regulator